jgi:hypothetical protein
MFPYGRRSRHILNKEFLIAFEGKGDGMTMMWEDSILETLLMKLRKPKAAAKALDVLSPACGSYLLLFPANSNQKRVKVRSQGCCC